MRAGTQKLRKHAPCSRECKRMEENQLPTQAYHDVPFVYVNVDVIPVVEDAVSRVRLGASLTVLGLGAAEEETSRA